MSARGQGAPCDPGTPRRVDEARIAAGMPGVTVSGALTWEDVEACTVVIIPDTIPNSSWRTLASGARQFVVHDAFEMTFMSGLYSFRLTPTTIVLVSASLAGADMTTFLAPAWMCWLADSVVRNFPVASITYSAPAAAQSS